jgi:hypothetical protein
MKSSERHANEGGWKLKHDAELRSIAVLRPADFTPEMVSAAKAELGRRNLPVPSPEEYWRDRPQEWLAALRFCYPCWAQTTGEWPGGNLTRKWLGVCLAGEVDPCPACGSVIETRALWFVVPVLPLGQYRVIHSAAGKIGRKLKAQ